MKPSLPDYREMLRQSLHEKARKNASFSLRSFALKAGVSHPLLSQVLNNRKNLSRESATRIVKHLGFEKKTSELFVELVEYSSTKNSAYREHLLSRIARLLPRQQQALELTLEMFTCMSEWYHMALLELTRVERITPTSSKTVARRLKISELQAKAALERLEKLGLLEHTKDGSLKKAAGIIETISGVPSAHIREHHRQMIQKATTALEEQPIDRRFIIGMSVAIDDAQLKEVQRRIEEFKQEMSAWLSQSPRKNSVYQLNFQFFELTKDRG